MILKEITLHGFKSFARPVTLDFSSPLTAVVGPNGSGKSNIVDAVRWVLGEQSPTSLRGSRMADVIFSGSDSHRAMQEARVSLKIDNSNNILPNEKDEITITREVNKEGEGSYIINGEQARLKDIEDLLFDTGLNQDAYSIVGQGRVEAILQSRPEKLRLLFEEAAGISRHRSRKEEAEKRLEKTARDLERVNDLITEIERRLGPLEKKAEKAKKYKKLYNRLKEIEVTYLCQEYHNYSKQEEQLQEQISALQERSTRLSRQMAAQEAREEQFKEQVAGLETDKEELLDSYYQYQTRIQEIENNLEVMGERRDSLQNEVERLDSEKARVQGEIEAASSQLDGLTGHLDSGQAELSNYQTYLIDICCGLEISARKQALLKAKSKENAVLDITASQAALKEELAELQEREQSYRRQLERLEEEKADLAAEARRLEDLRQELEEQVSSLAEQVIAAEADQQQVKEKKRQQAEVQAELESREEKLRSQYNRTRSRWQALKKMADRGEGYYQGVRSVWQNDELEGIIGPVAELISTAEKYEQAIATALGSRLQQVVVQDDKSAREAIAFLKKQQAGRATFLPLNMISGRELNPDRYQLKSQPGYLGLGSELVDYEDNIDEVITYLLGRTVIFSDLDQATAASKASGNNLRIVTLEGEIINPGGAMTGGSQRKDTAQLLSRQRQLEELAEQGRKQREELQKVRSQQEAEAEVQAQLQEQEEELQAELAGYREELKVSQTRLNSVHEQEEKTSLEEEKLAAQQQAEASKLARLQQQREQVKSDLAKLQAQASQQRDEQVRIEAALRQSQEQTARLNRAYQDIQLELARQEEQLNSRQRRYQEQQTELVEQRQRLEEIQAEQAELEASLAALEERRRDLEVRKAETAEQQVEVELKKETCQQELEQSRQELEKLSAELKADRTEEKELEEEIHQKQLKQGKLKARQERIAGRLEDKYNLSPTAALSEAEKMQEQAEQTEGGRPENPAEEIKKLDKKIKALGQVSLAAIDDYRELNERYNYLQGEQEDLIQAKTSIEEVITDLETRMADLFYATYSEVNQHFQDIFTQLFLGGQATLELTDPDDLLTTGVEINACPPGKKLQKLSLLSGGEKAMTAISLVFAFLKVKPSPFYILDEIDAPLDEANIEIFADFIQDFVEDNQFVLITHRKQMMAAADCIYGVTMAESGISRLVSIDLDQETSA